MNGINAQNTFNLEKVCNDRNNNLDIIRLVAAFLVIFSHSFPISYGAKYGDYLYYLTEGKLNLGGLAVSVFFVTGGFLIAKSAVRLQSFKGFFRARCLRILPALIFTTCCLVFVLGPIVTKLSMTEYFTDTGTYRYLLNSILVLQHNLPGVFEGNIYGQTVNGPLWTLPIEFACYIFCFIAMKLGFLNKKRFLISIPIFCIGCIGLWLLSSRILLLGETIRPLCLFYIGMGMFVFKDNIKLNKLIALIMCLLLVLFFYLGFVNTGLLLFFPYIIFTLAYATRFKLNFLFKKGEFSYGIYLWGWPIQQIICEQFGGSMNNYINTVFTLPLAVVMGIVSFNLIEKPALKFKKKKQLTLRRKDEKACDYTSL